MDSSLIRGDNISLNAANLPAQVDCYAHKKISMKTSRFTASKKLAGKWGFNIKTLAGWPNDRRLNHDIQ